MRVVSLLLVAICLTVVSAQNLSIQQLKQILPDAGKKADWVYPFLMKAMKDGGINTCPRIKAFIAQIGHECGQFHIMTEHASGKAYEGRRDLGNVRPGDGVRYKGRGPIQITGRECYQIVSKLFKHDFINHPEDVAKPEWGFKIAVWYWNSRKLNLIADRNNQEAFNLITKRVNGGYNGKKDRDRLYARAKQVLKC
eukprot:TRINITY_DN8186_c0_g1_i1.p1 TRINITY_DN8186_c0_g1~~TRINITY_DN8186_c0_g1_i1.p1  ORF type:complete len:196 (+),score=46.00 TRINITY_DN8186_c0_g1_i1:131-718(+)